MTEGYIGNMERGLKVPSLTTILPLAVALNCKVTDLVGIFDKIDLPLGPAGMTKTGDGKMATDHRRSWRNLSHHIGDAGPALRRSRVIRVA